MTHAGEPRRRRPPADPETVPLRPFTPRRQSRRARRRRASPFAIAGKTLVALVSVFVLAATGTAWKTYHTALAGVTTSDALSDGPKSDGKDQNILIMGLDSRLDEHGNPLPQDMYNALHAGDDSVGGYNSNVLILIHIPGDGSKSTAISIPRDDYITLDPASCETSSPCKGKVKQAYGFAYGKAKDKLVAQGVKDQGELEQRSRDAGRKAEIATVRSFLGGVPVDHFVEVTLVAFFQVAQAIAPITVCLNEKTQDDFSGADFPKGTQQLDAQQAMAFVRQRRDPDPTLNFTDLDRTRRQQAFIVSVARKLQDGGTLTSPSKLRSLLDIAKQNIAVDSGLDLVQFAQRATELMSGGLSLFTLPVKDFGQDSVGEDVNLVDVGEIRGIVRGLIPPTASSASSSGGAPTADPLTAAAAGMTINVVNGAGATGLAAKVVQALTARGFTAGEPVTGSTRSSSSVTYGTGAQAAATALADQLGLTATPSSAVDAKTVVLTIGTDDAEGGSISALTGGKATGTEAGSTASSTSATTTTTAPAPVPVPATASGNGAPAPTDLSSMDSSGVPCVK